MVYRNVLFSSVSSAGSMLKKMLIVTDHIVKCIVKIKTYALYYE